MRGECTLQAPRADVFAFPGSGVATLVVAIESLLSGITGWLTRRLAGAGLAALAAAAVYGAWLYLRQEALQEWERRGRLETALADREKVGRARESLVRRTVALEAEVVAQEAVRRQAEAEIAELRAAQGWWDRWFGDPAKRAGQAERIGRAEARRDEAGARLTAARQSLEQAGWEREGIEAAWRRINEEVGFLERERSWLVRQLGAIWERVRWYVVGGAALYLLGPLLWALLLYHGFAPLASGGAPLRFAAEVSDVPACDVGAGGVTLELRLNPGERLLVRERHLQASDEDLGRGTRFVFDWRMPFTCLACGLVELVELRHRRGESASRVTLSGGGDRHTELALVTVPEGASLMLRPSFLAAVVEGPAERLRVRRHWRWGRLAWVTGMFRHFEFVGPCRLVVAGGRGVRAEQLGPGSGGEERARRINRGATIAFSPGLACRPVRAETFWAYYRGMNPLFDDLFSGRGVLVAQEAVPGDEAAAGRRRGAAVWSGVLRLFGL